MRKIKEQINEDMLNARLFGNDDKTYIFLTPEEGCRLILDSMIKNAKTIKDLDVIGLKLNETIDNNYNIGIMDYQFKAARKMTEIYKNLGIEEKTEVKN
jgi:hypothetical protein